MPNVDFAELKRDVSIIQVLDMLDIKVLHVSGETRRANCPLCNTSRALAATPGKGWYCHRCKANGSIIDLVMKVRGVTDREAALAIQAHVAGTVQNRCSTVPKGNSARNSSPSDRTKMLQAILERLQPEHEAVQGLGISPETAQLFEIGYDGAGVLKGRYLAAIRSIGGELLAFVGIAVKSEQSPRMAFSNFEPATTLFNAHRAAEEAELMLCRSPLEAILAVEHGAPIESVVAFLTESVSPHQFEILSSLMDQRRIEACWL